MPSPTPSPSSPMHNPQPDKERLLSCDLDDRWRHQLDQIVSEVLNDGQDNLYQILPFIEWKLWSFCLQHKYEARDIFLEAYERAVKLVEQQEIINSLPAWLKSTSFNIIREYARKAGKLKMATLDDQQLANLSVACMTDEDIEAQVTWLLSELGQLKTEDQEILQLRMQGCSYEEIMRQRGGTVIALRQKVSRLLKQLRKNASQLEP